MIFLAGCVGGNPQSRDHQVLHLLARQHPASGLGATARLIAAGDVTLGASCPNSVAATDDGRFMLACDARLDDRQALQSAVRLSPSANDAELILAAWVRWGPGAPNRIYGAFAFVLWDAAEQSLHLARDPIGLKPLFFLPGGAAFASRADAFDVIDSSHAAPDESALAAHLAFARSGSATLYRGVERVLPGELVSLGPRGAARHIWWQPSTTPVRQKPDESVVECRALLERAVSDSIAGADRPIATHLSAGLDSGVATALAAHLRPEQIGLDAFTAVPAPGTKSPGRLANEGPYAAIAAAALPRVRHHEVSATTDALAYFAEAARMYQQPLPNPYNHGWAAAIHRSAATAGAEILLLGQTGNYSFSMAGDPHRRVKRAIKRVLSAFRRTPPAHSLFGPAVMQGMFENPPPLGGAERRLHFLRRLDPAEYFKGIESEWGLVARDPFADRRLIEFSLTLPDATLAALGDRGLGRPVAATLLPAEFVQNRARGFQSADWIDRFRRAAPAAIAMIAQTRDHAILRNILNLDAVAAAAARLDQVTEPDPADERLYRTDLPRALAVMAFVHALTEPSSRPEATAWQGARL